MEGTSQALSYTIRFVGLLGSHALGSNPRFMAIAVDLGRELVKRKIRLTYGGGNVGLQGAVASAVYNNGGRVRGFHPRAFIVLSGGIDTMEDDAVRQNFMALNQRKLFISSFFVDELLDKLEFSKVFLGPRASYDEFVNPGRLDLELHL
ncbi:hypothetical protein DM860_014050 [Cuscuta australis]|uniref:Cytokinin riboside 5'-monophosphate phosphoribohydrolase n=1 Tax=Cuscuta australis TaxID=267555 RepID=A0A328DNV1_9ASTE|nr:hypothetical protein DM860_014050 [Cuscuta australis]